jgi:hypothetical protein
VRKTQKVKVDAIMRLRLAGHSIPEISAKTSVPKTTVQRYVKNVVVPHEYMQFLREKQGGSKQRANGLRENVGRKAEQFIGLLSDRDRALLLIGLYWGEGAKNDFSIINSDVYLLKTFVECLQTLDVGVSRLRAGVRVHVGTNVDDAKTYWSKELSIPKAQFTQVEIVHGRKKGKLLYGMCRVRITKGIKERIYLQKAIQYIGKSV